MAVAVVGGFVLSGSHFRCNFCSSRIKGWPIQVLSLLVVNCMHRERAVNHLVLTIALKGFFKGLISAIVEWEACFYHACEFVF